MLTLSNCLVNISIDTHRVVLLSVLAREASLCSGQQLMHETHKQFAEKSLLIPAQDILTMPPLPGLREHHEGRGRKNAGAGGWGGVQCCGMLPLAHGMASALLASLLLVTDLTRPSQLKVQQAAPIGPTESGRAEGE